MSCRILGGYPNPLVENLNGSTKEARQVHDLYVHWWGVMLNLCATDGLEPVHK